MQDDNDNKQPDWQATKRATNIGQGLIMLVLGIAAVIYMVIES